MDSNLMHAAAYFRHDADTANRTHSANSLIECILMSKGIVGRPSEGAFSALWRPEHLSPQDILATMSEVRDHFGAIALVIAPTLAGIQARAETVELHERRSIAKAAAVSAIGLRYGCDFLVCEQTLQALAHRAEGIHAGTAILEPDSDPVLLYHVTRLRGHEPWQTYVPPNLLRGREAI